MRLAHGVRQKSAAGTKGESVRARFRFAVASHPVDEAVRRSRWTRSREIRGFARHDVSSIRKNNGQGWGACDAAIIDNYSVTIMIISEKTMVTRSHTSASGAKPGKPYEQH